MSKTFNKVNSNIDFSLLSIKSDDVQKEDKNQSDQILFNIETNQVFDNRNIKVEHALKILNQQWRIIGLRKRTIDSYNYNFKRLIDATKVTYMHEINADTIYQFLSSLGDVKDTTLHGCLKQIKSVLSRCHDNGWYQTKFWRNIKIKVDEVRKEAATETELALLLSLLDKTTFRGFRDSCAILLLYKTGIRIRTLAELRECHVDFENKLLNMSGDIMKSHRSHLMPLDEQMCTLLKELININNEIRKENKQKNDYIFLSNIGVPIADTVSPSNAIAKNLWVYSKRWNLKNVNPHSIRRLFAQNLLRKGANVNLISHALNHTDLSTTSRYLGIDSKEVAKNLRDYL
ncbi:MAG: tyrosine-type recombinase/integrase [Erysipelotrichaceae bacterium]